MTTSTELSPEATALFHFAGSRWPILESGMSKTAVLLMLAEYARARGLTVELVQSAEGLAKALQDFVTGLRAWATETTARLHAIKATATAPASD